MEIGSLILPSQSLTFLAKQELELCCHLRQFSNMQDFSTGDWSNICWGERKQRNRPAFSGHKLNFEGHAISVAMDHCPYVTSFQAVFINVMRQNDRIQFTKHATSTPVRQRSSFLLTPNPYTIFLNNPQVMFNRLLLD
jgi:hypothetical protein